MKDYLNKGFAAGVVLMVLFACTATYIAGFDWVREWRFSPLIVGILLGMLFANTLRKEVPAAWDPGILFCSKQVLRFGIVLYGFQVTISDVMSVGLPALVTDALVVTLTMMFGVLMGKLLRMDAQTALLTSVGASVCGAAAVLAADPVVKGESYKTAVAVSTVVIFGTISMFLYPACYRAGVYDMDARQVGLYTGATLHEVAHVYGAGEAMNGTDDSVKTACGAMSAAREHLNKAVDTHLQLHPEEEAGLAEPVASMNAACDTLRGKFCELPDFAEQAHADIRTPAVIVKMLRVIMLAPLLIVLSFILSRAQKNTDGTRAKIQVPLFAVMFLVVIGFNSLQLLPEAAVAGIKSADTFLLTMAMSALGAETSFDKFKKAGAKPFLLALLLFFWLVFGGYWLVKGVTELIH
ncbi:MAG: YeiH family protein [Akkermansia sp.]|nr:YeiH family protein [Akkermansia sp.]